MLEGLFFLGICLFGIFLMMVSSCEVAMYRVMLYTCRPAGALMYVSSVLLYTYRPAGAKERSGVVHL